jgi:hypothetical protein
MIIPPKQKRMKRSSSFFFGLNPFGIDYSFMILTALLPEGVLTWIK